MLKQLDVALDIPGIKASELVLLLRLLELLVISLTVVLSLLARHLLDHLKIILDDHEVRHVVIRLDLLRGHHADLEVLDHLVEHLVALFVVHVAVGVRVRDVVLLAHLLVELLGQVS